MKKILLPAFVAILMLAGCKKKDTPASTTPATYNVNCKAQSAFGVLTTIQIKINNVLVKDYNLDDASKGKASFDTSFTSKAGDAIYMIAYPYDMTQDRETQLTITANSVITKATYKDSDKKGVSYTLPK